MDKKNLLKKPSFRKLKGYAFDPSLSLSVDTLGINEIVYSIPWENLSEGPEGEFVKVVDRDPSSDATYSPVNLNEPEILANEGITPDVSNPQFHQQMVYAVAMNTITNFEKAIGRQVMWSPVLMDRKVRKNGVIKKIRKSEFVQQLLIYPHALRDVNAYYSPERKALLFGYFNATPTNPDLHMPGSLVFSCLSHDIVAHETTHAILDGIFKNYMDSTHPDVGAFHEAFADIVALFQHFTFPNAMRHQIAKTRGRFNAESLLGQLAVEFGKASGYYSSLRDAIGQSDEKTGAWSTIKPNINAYKEVFEPHDRGSILVAAVFDAFICIYNQRTDDLIRIATNGTGILPEGRLNYDLVNRLADEAARTSSNVLNMCIRALDYCPPVDINYGDYLRAIITADMDLVSYDDRNYRIAFINAFRKWGIYPEGISVLSEETLNYSSAEISDEMKFFSNVMTDFLRDYKNCISYEKNREEIFKKTLSFINGDLYKSGKNNEHHPGLHEYFFGETVKNKKNSVAFERLTGLVFSDMYKKLNIKTSGTYKTGPSLEIHTIQLNNRVGPDGNLQNQAVITLSQRCGVKVVQNAKTNSYNVSSFKLNSKKEYDEGCFIFRGGCTLIFDLDTNELKHVISKPIFDREKFEGKRRKYIPDYKRAVMQYRTSWGDYAELTGFAAKNNLEPFAHIHKPKFDTND